MSKLFSEDTIKPLDKIFNRKYETKLFKKLMENSACFSVSGLRRVGKTTLIRSVAASIKDILPVYINLWGFEGSISTLLSELTDKNTLRIKESAWIQRKAIRIHQEP